MLENYTPGTHDDNATWLRSLIRVYKRFESTGSTAHCAAMPRNPRRR